MSTRGLMILVTLPLWLSPPARGQAPGDAPASMLEGTYTLEFVGWDGRERVNLWRGAVEGALEGEVVMRLALAMSDERANERLWPVTVRWSVDAGARSFDARLAGWVNWLTGRLRLIGQVTSGYWAGADIGIDGNHVEVDGLGTFRLERAAAAVSAGSPAAAGSR